MLDTAASGGSLLYDQCVPFAILKPKNRKTESDGMEREAAYLHDLP
jgi:hypothetical protein